MSEIYIVIFLLADEAYSIPVSRVQEIQGYHAHPAPRQIPDTPPHFEGIIDLRGMVIPILDLRFQFGLPKAAPTRKSCYIIIDTQSEKVGLLVDAVVEVQRLSPDAFQSPPTSMKTAISRDYIVGVGKLASKSASQSEPRLVIQLDVDKLLGTGLKAQLS